MQHGVHYSGVCFTCCRYHACTSLHTHPHADLQRVVTLLLPLLCGDIIQGLWRRSPSLATGIALNPTSSGIKAPADSDETNMAGANVAPLTSPTPCPSPALLAGAAASPNKITTTAAVASDADIALQAMPTAEQAPQQQGLEPHQSASQQLPSVPWVVVAQALPPPLSPHQLLDMLQVSGIVSHCVIM